MLYSHSNNHMYERIKHSINKQVLLEVLNQLTCTRTYKRKKTLLNFIHYKYNPIVNTIYGC